MFAKKYIRENEMWFYNYKLKPQNFTLNDSKWKWFHAINIIIKLLIIIIITLFAIVNYNKIEVKFILS